MTRSAGGAPNARVPQLSAPAETAIIPTLQVRLFGGFELRGPGDAGLRLTTRKAEALVALLALQPGQPQPRDKVCALLWPDVRDAQARHSLRQTLSQLRKALAGAAGVLQSDARSLQLVAADVQVDVAVFDSCVSLGTRAALLAARQAYRGDLLEGIAVDEEPFERWLHSERERLRSRLVHALTQLVSMDTAAERYADATDACTKLLQLDPLREEAHRALMRLLALQGRRAAAMQQYRALSRLLHDELGTAPDQLTRQLHAEIEADDGAGAGPGRAVDSGQRGAPLAPARASAVITTGRRRELAQLTAALPASLADGSDGAGPAPVSLLCGEAGAGKSHLCDHLVHEAQLRGFTVLRARCFESEQVLPLALWANLLRSVIQPALPLSAEQRAALVSLFPELAEEPHGRTADARRLFHAVHELVDGLSQRAPLLLLLEDVHWVDEMSARLISYLGRRVSHARCVIVLSARTEELAAAGFIREAFAELASEQRLSRVELVPLSRDETYELAERLAEARALAPLDTGLLEQIWGISEGNPLVIVESVRALACGTLGGDVTRLPVPERVRSLIMSRVAKVSAAARELLAVAAVAGRELDPEVLVSALDATSLSAALDELAQAQLVRACEERVYFTHDRIRETVYGEMLPVLRRLLHARVASALERHSSATQHAVLGHIGYHYSRAGDAPAAVRYLVRFADSAWRDHGVHEALVALEQAFADSARLPAAERDLTAVEITIRQAYCLASLGRFAELTSRLQALSTRVQRLDAPRVAAAFHFFWGLSLALQAEPRDAEAHAQRALALAQTCDDTLTTGYAHALLSYLCQMTGRYSEGIAHGELATARLARCDDSPDASAIAWLSLGLNQLWLGEPRAALAASEQAAAIARRAGSFRAEALASTVAGCVHAYTDEWEQALEVTQRAVELSKEPTTLVSALWMTAWAQSGSGQTTPAIALLTQVIEALAQHGMRGWSAHALTILADAQLRSGDPVRATQIAAEALEIAAATGDRACVGWATRVHGQAALARADLPRAQSHFDRCIGLFEELHSPLDLAKTLVERAALAIEQGRAEPAQLDLQRARELFVKRGVHASVPRIDELEAAIAARQKATQLRRPSISTI